MDVFTSRAKPGSKKYYANCKEELIPLIKKTVESFGTSVVGVEKDTKSRVKLFVPTPQDRGPAITKLKQQGFIKVPKPNVSSIGVFCKEGLQVTLKYPIEGGGHGKKNEQIALDLLQGIEKVVVKGDNGVTQTISSIHKAIDSSTNGAHSGNKSDIDFYDVEGNLLCGWSIKKGLEDRLDSCKKRFPDQWNEFPQRLLSGDYEKYDLYAIEHPDAKGTDRYKMVDSTGKSVSKVILENMCSSYEKDIIFGNDEDKVMVVVQDFSAAEYEKIGNTLTIYVQALYTNIEQLREENKQPKPYFGNHIRQKFGIEFRCQPASALEYKSRANIRHLDFNTLNG